MTTEQKRTQLLNMTRGATPIVLLYNVGYNIVAVEVERVTPKTAGGFAMPYEADAMRRICEAIGAENAQSDTEAQQRNEARADAKKDGMTGRMFTTWQHYEDDADDADIRAAMDAVPCLVNYGGTLRAVNVEAGGSRAAIILKDMQA